MEMTLPMIDMPKPDKMPTVTDAMAAKTLVLDKLAAIDAERAALVEQLQAQATAERAELIRGIRETMQTHGITLADLGAKPVTHMSPGEPKVSALIGKKLAPKYRDQTTGETWSGRGLQPKWLKARIAGGAELESFRVA